MLDAALDRQRALALAPRVPEALPPLLLARRALLLALTSAELLVLAPRRLGRLVDERAEAGAVESLDELAEEEEELRRRAGDRALLPPDLGARVRRLAEVLADERRVGDDLAEAGVEAALEHADVAVPLAFGDGLERRLGAVRVVRALARVADEEELGVAVAAAEPAPPLLLLHLLALVLVLDLALALRLRLRLRLAFALFFLLLALTFLLLFLLLRLRLRLCGGRRVAPPALPPPRRRRLLLLLLPPSASSSLGSISPRFRFDARPPAAAAAGAAAALPLPLPLPAKAAATCSLPKLHFPLCLFGLTQRASRTHCVPRSAATFSAAFARFRAGEPSSASAGTSGPDSRLVRASIRRFRSRSSASFRSFCLCSSNSS